MGRKEEGRSSVAFTHLIVEINLHGGVALNISLYRSLFHFFFFQFYRNHPSID